MVEGRRPEVRARHPLTMLELIEETDAAAHAEVRSLLSAPVRGRLDDALTVAWIPVADDVAVIDAVERVLGRQKLHALTLTRQEREFGSPLFRSFISGALVVVGTSPASVVRRIPLGWGLLFRNCCRFEVSGEGASWMRLAMHDVPRECLASEAWMSCLPVAYASATSVVKRVSRGAIEVRAGSAYVTITWT